VDANGQALAYVYCEDEPGARCHLNVMRGQLRFARQAGTRWKSSVDSTVPPSAKLPHTMMDVAMMTLPVSVTIRRDCRSSSQRLAG